MPPRSQRLAEHQVRITSFRRSNQTNHPAPILAVTARYASAMINCRKLESVTPTGSKVRQSTSGAGILSELHLRVPRPKCGGAMVCCFICCCSVHSPGYQHLHCPAGMALHSDVLDKLGIAACDRAAVYHFHIPQGPRRMRACMYIIYRPGRTERIRGVFPSFAEDCTPQEFVFFGDLRLALENCNCVPLIPLVNSIL